MKKRKVKRVHSEKKPHYGIRRIVFGIICLAIGSIVLFAAISINSAASNLLTIKIHRLDNSTLNWNKDWALTLLTGTIDSRNILSKLSIISFDKNQINSVSLPEGMSMIYNNNPENIDASFALASLQNSSTAMNHLEEVIQQNTFLHIDGYFFVRKDTQNPFINISNPSHAVRGVNTLWIIGNTGTINEFLSQDVYSNVPVQTLYTLASALSSGEKIVTYQISNSDTNLQNFYSDISQNFSDTYLTDEHARISIYNGSGKAGKADFLSQILKAEGEVIDYTGTANNSVTQTTIYTATPGNFPDTIKKLQQIFHAKVVNHQYSLTSDISIVLGSDVLSVF